MYSSLSKDVTSKILPEQLVAGRRQTGLRSWVSNQRLLVTGAGGSIGSELCRQIAAAYPKRLIAIDHNVNALYSMKTKLRRDFPSMVVHAIVADSTDKKAMARLLQHQNVSLILHAAAYKHLPLMEQDPIAAVTNNVLGTHRMLKIAHDLQIPRFVLISSDKAVYPSSVMGATKRLGELLISALNSETTVCTATRFGNVLGSSGSVLPLFQKQIQTGGPVTITHAHMERYFIEIHEAARLVVQASHLATGGEIFVPEMGKPLKIIDLARNLIRSAGLEPDKDIPIKFIGIRPGEKLYESLAYSDEQLVNSRYPKIRFARQNPTRTDSLTNAVSQIEEAVSRTDGETLLEILEDLLPGYRASKSAWKAVSSCSNTEFNQ